MNDSQNDASIDLPRPDELTVLKERAKLMGIQHSPNIGVSALRAKIEEKQAALDAATSGAEPSVNALEVSDDGDPAPRVETLREKLLREQMKLIRLRITNLDPKKNDLPGEIFTVANEYIGTVRKYVPFGEVTDQGYHVPYCIYTMMKDRKFLHVSVKKRANGVERPEQRWEREFALEILPPLTQDELTKLGAAQMAAGLFNEDKNEAF